MTVWLFVWLVASLATGVTVVTISIGLVKRLFVLGRTLQQFQAEVQPALDDITRESARAAERGSTLGERSSFRRA